MVRYVFRSDEAIPIKAASKADAQAIGTALEKISAQNGGELSPGAIVEAARNSRHVLHKHFEWDNEKAAEAYRLDQARAIVRLIRTIDEESETEPRAFVSVKGDNGTSYRSHSEVKKSADLQMAVLKQARADLESFQRRFRDLTEVYPDIAAAIEKIDRRLGAGEARAA